MSGFYIKLIKRHTTLLNRILILMQGCVIGLLCAVIIGSFRLIRDVAISFSSNYLLPLNGNPGKFIIGIIFLLISARILGGLIKNIPLISGGGIPQAELAIEEKIHINRLEWLKILVGKFFGTLLAMICGLSLGKEGPCVQMGSAAASLASSLWIKFESCKPVHLAVGAGAGLAAAFGAPLAGFFFIFEEMKFEKKTDSFFIAIITLCSSVFFLNLFFAFPPVFSFYTPVGMGIHEHITMPFFGIFIGLCGVFFNHSLVKTKNLEVRYTPLPQQWRMLPAMFIAFLCCCFCPQILGGGESLILALSESTHPALFILCFLALLKFLFTMLSNTGDIPGGLLMPMLCCASLFTAIFFQILLETGFPVPESWGNILLCGMAGFFIAVRRSFLTGICLITEMSHAYMLIPDFFLVGISAYLTANALHCPPIYTSLKDAIVILPRQKVQKN